MRETVSRSVLIVDDNKLDQQLLRVHLEPQGYELEIANDGVEAMELLLSKMGKTKNNGEFLSSMAQGK